MSFKLIYVYIAICNLPITFIKRYVSTHTRTDLFFFNLFHHFIISVMDRHVLLD